MSGAGGAEGRQSRTAAVIVASTRAAEGVYPDRAGPLLVDWLRERGFATAKPVVVPDGPGVGAALRAAISDGADVIVTSGGTGISPTDGTPEQTAPLLTSTLPGLADAIRNAGLPQVPTAILSRGLAGVAQDPDSGARSLVVNLPGSTGGVRDGLGVLAGVIDHAVDQLRGGDHG